ncbi:TPA: hydrogenase formation protein HypD [Candidatus Sumerlaeota bacterium]|jgi:hydrogenase expression/formation protein HypD|nr:hydrogenase formation protein HypD [Candidatus Sumerlaeota bacterium]
MDAQKIQALVQELHAVCTRPIRLMEVCGTHTVAFFRTGVKGMLPPNLRMLSGPGCPVCVTAQGYVDAACELALRPGVTVCTFGDMVRVPGRNGSLADCRGRGAKVRVVYSARDALKFAQQNQTEQVVFLGVGFETTAPGAAVVAQDARRHNVQNFSILNGHKRVLPAMMLLLSQPDTAIDGFLCPGHVSIILGANAYQPIIDKFHKPCVIAGFEPQNLLESVLALTKQVINNEAKLENAYTALVTPEGNLAAQAILNEVFEPGPAVWRAMGTLPESGLNFRADWREFDAAERFDVNTSDDFESPGCRCGDVLQGKLDPPECALFGTACNPVNPIGPCMVSSEGSCAAWYKYHR